MQQTYRLQRVSCILDIGVFREMLPIPHSESTLKTIRLIFGEPQKLTRISPVFEETETQRTQESAPVLTRCIRYRVRAASWRSNKTVT